MEAHVTTLDTSTPRRIGQQVLAGGVEVGVSAGTQVA
jgi:hypothetical protein